MRCFQCPSAQTQSKSRLFCREQKRMYLSFGAIAHLMRWSRKRNIRNRNRSFDVSRLFPGRGIPEIRRCCQCPAQGTSRRACYASAGPAPSLPVQIPQPSSSSGPLAPAGVHIQVNASGSEPPRRNHHDDPGPPGSESGHLHGCHGHGRRHGVNHIILA
jgi:hypothetical protein